MDAAGQRIRAHSVALGAALQAIVACADVVLLAPLRAASSRRTQAQAGCASRHRCHERHHSRLRSDSKIGKERRGGGCHQTRPMGWHPPSGVWTLVRELRDSVWLALTRAALRDVSALRVAGTCDDHREKMTQREERSAAA